MYTRLGFGLVCGFMLVGCSDSGVQKVDDGEILTVADSAAAPPAEPNHETHAMLDAVADGLGSAGATPVMDHAAMAEADRSDPTNTSGEHPMDHEPADIEQMDHGQMDSSPAQSASPVMDHAHSPAGGTQDSSGPAHTMDGMPAGARTVEHGDPLLMLVRALVQDSVVQRKIEGDPILREAWSDPGVRDVILEQP